MFSYWKEEIKRASTIFSVNKMVNILETKMFCLDEIKKLTKDDIIVYIDSDGVLFLKPISIYFKNGCFVMGHNLIGRIFLGGSHFFNEDFDGFTCLTLNNKLSIYSVDEGQFTSQFILKCNENRYSKNIEIVKEWFEYLEMNYK